MQRFNKTTVSAVITALGVLAVTLWPEVFTATKIAAVQGVLNTLLVFFVPNVEA